MNDWTPQKLFRGSKVVATFLFLYGAGCCYAQQVAEQVVAAHKTLIVYEAASSPSNSPSKIPTVETSSISSSISTDEMAYNAQDSAITAAVADSVTTGLALSAGAVETNALITTTPLGLIALAGMKVGVVKYADTLPEQEKRTAFKSASALWGGAAVNNIMVFMAAPPPFPIVAGLIASFVTWVHIEGKYRKEDERIAARNRKAEEIAANNGTITANGVETSGN